MTAPDARQRLGPHPPSVSPEWSTLSTWSVVLRRLRTKRARAATAIARRPSIIAAPCARRHRGAGEDHFDAGTGELLGAHLIGAEATELIQGFAIAIQLETTEAELASTIFPHPTLSEMMGESVLDAYGRALHI